MKTNWNKSKSPKISLKPKSTGKSKPTEKVIIDSKSGSLKLSFLL